MKQNKKCRYNEFITDNKCKESNSQATSRSILGKVSGEERISCSEQKERERGSDPNTNSSSLPFLSKLDIVCSHEIEDDTEWLSKDE